jgi:SnoaL-like protein
MTQINIDATVAAYAAAWNEPDEAARRHLLETAWAATGAYTDPTAHVEGREALVQHITGFLKSSPGARIVATSRTDSHHGALRFSWRLIRADGTTIDGMDFGQLDGEGRLTRIVGFFGPFVPLDR